MSSTSQALAPKVAEPCGASVMISGYVASRSRRLPRLLRPKLPGGAPRARLGAGQTGAHAGPVHLHHARPAGASTRPTGRSCAASTCRSFPGAKIGVIGANGSGKSSLLRIMAGLDDGFTGEARLTAGFTVGYLSQEPRARSGQGRRRQRHRRGGRDQAAARALRRGVRGHGRARRRLRQAAGRAGASSRTASTPPGRGIWTASSRSPWTPCASPLPTPTSPTLSGGERRAGGPVPAAAFQPRTCSCSTSRPTTSTPSRWPGWNGRCRTTRARSWPLPTTGTSSTTWPAGSWSSTAASASRGRATTPPGWSRSRPAWPARRRPTRPGSGRWSASSSGSACRPGPARARARRGSPPTTSWSPRPRRAERRAQTGSRSPSRRGPGWATWWSRRRR